MLCFTEADDEEGSGDTAGVVVKSIADSRLFVGVQQGWIKFATAVACCCRVEVDRGLLDVALMVWGLQLSMVRMSELCLLLTRRMELQELWGQL